MHARGLKLAVLMLCAFALAGCGRSPDREISRGIRALHRGRFVEARTRFEKALALRPGHPESARIYEYLGHACWRLNEVTAAATAFQESRRLDPENPRAIYNLGVIYASAGDTVRAAALFEEAALAAPSMPEPLEYLAHLHLSERRWAEAMRTLEAARARGPRSARLLTRMALAELQMKGPEAAIARWMSALELEPDYPPALFNLFAIHAYRLNRPAEAVAHGRRFLAVAPRHSYAAAVQAYIASVQAQRATPLALSGTPPVERLATARRLAAEGRTLDAVRLCLEVAEAARTARNVSDEEQALKTAVEVAFDVAEAHAALGRFYLGQGREEAALRSLKQAVVLGDATEPTLLALGEAAERAGEADTALVALRRAASAPRASPDAQWRLAVFFDRLPDHAEDAAREYRVFLSRFPNDSRVLRARERLQALGAISRAPPPRSREPAPAVRSPPESAVPAIPAPAPPTPPRRIEWRPPRERKPTVAATAYNRAAEYYRNGDLDRAIFFFTRAIENDDTLAEAFVGLGNAYLEQGDAERAADAYRLAAERRPNDAAVLYNLAVAQFTIGARAEAVETTRRVLRIRPDFAEAHYLLGRLLADDPQQRVEARQYLERFLTLAPADPKAESVRRWLAESR